MLVARHDDDEIVKQSTTIFSIIDITIGSNISDFNVSVINCLQSRSVGGTESSLTTEG